MKDFNKVMLVGIFVLLSVQLFTNYNEHNRRFEVHQSGTELVLIDTKYGDIYSPKLNGEKVLFRHLVNGMSIDEGELSKWELIVEK